MKPIRILHVTPSYFPATYWGGPIHSIYGLNKALASFQGVTLQVLTTNSAGPALSEKLRMNELDAEGLFNNYSVHFAHRLAGRSTSLELLLILPAYIQKADVVHVSSTYSFPILPTFFFCRILNKPLVWSPCGAILDSQKLQFSRKKTIKLFWEYLINLLILPEKMVLHATSREEEEVSVKRIPRARSVIYPHGVEIPFDLPERLPQENGQLRLLFLSRLDPKKGLENLLSALYILNDPSITLQVCGTGDPAYVSKLQDEARRLDLLNGGVQFTGEVVGDQKTAAFQNADVFILPSYSESFGVAIAEALAQGLPVIVSKNTPWQEIEKVGCGLWVDNDPQSLAQAIQKIRRMDPLLIGKKGYEWMQRDYSWEVIAKAMLDVYLSLLN
ncbi:MAG: glycosyltransferase [Anaerolineaceae bacterium]